jgi:uncharacterized protein
VGTRHVDPGASLIDIPAADLPAALEPTVEADAWAPDAADPPTGLSAGRSVGLLILLATGTGLVTGFLGVGGGFLVVPALVLSLRMPMANATATGLVVIAIASTTSLALRVGHTGTIGQPMLLAVLVLTAVAASAAAARFSGRLSPRTLGTGFALLVLGMSVLVASAALAALG